MNKSSFLVGLVMLAAAVVFIYVEEPVTIRIICGAIFLIGAVLLYFTIANVKDEDGDPDESNKSRTEKPPAKSEGADTLALEFRDTANTQHSQVKNNNARQEYVAVEQPSQPTFPYQRKDVAIPEEYYKGGEAQVPVDDPRGEFDFLIRKLLVVLKDLLIANTVGLFWINRDRKQVVIGEYVTDSKHFTTMRRVPLSQDLISQVGMNGHPEIVVDIPTTSEQDLLIYYDMKEGVHSCVAVPVYFMNESIAVLAADSKAPDAFGIETVATVGHFTTLVATLLKSYNQKYDLAADSKLLNTLDRMQKTIHIPQDAIAISSATALAVSESVDWDYITIIIHDAKKQEWIVAKSQSKSANIPYVKEGTTLDVEKGIWGKGMQKMKGVITNAPTLPEFRFEANEKIESIGQLCLVPLLSSTRCFGTIIIEYKEKHQYGERDLDILERIASLASMYFEIQSLNDLVRTQLLIDEVTRVGSRAFLVRRLHEERARFIAHGGDLTFFLVSIDRPEDIIEKHSRYGMDAFLVHVAKTLQSVMKPYDVLAKFDPFKFGVLLINTGAEDAYLHGEKIRKAIASSVVAFSGTSFSATVSVGGCVLTPTMETTQLVKIVQQVIDRANSEGGNTVKIV